MKKKKTSLSMSESHVDVMAVLFHKVHLDKRPKLNRRHQSQVLQPKVPIH